MTATYLEVDRVTVVIFYGDEPRLKYFSEMERENKKGYQEIRIMVEVHKVVRLVYVEEE